MRPLVLALSAVIFIASACSSPQATSTSATAEPPSVRFDAKPAAADGYIFSSGGSASGPRSADGWRDGDVALTRDATAPAGFVPYAGNVQLIDAIDGSVTATTKPDVQGLTTFSNVAAGRYKLRVTTASAHDFPITLIGGATVRWGTYPITRPRAYEIAKQLVASAIRPNLTFIAAPQTPVPSGVILSPALGDADGNVTAATDHAVGSPSWFFYVDAFAEMRFDHPVKYVLVDAVSGDAKAFDENSWPALNRQQYYRLNEDAAASADVLLLPTGQSSSAAPPVMAQHVVGGAPRPRELAAQPEMSTTIVADHVPGCSSPPITYALLVQGTDESSENRDMKNIKTLLPAATVIYEVLSPPGGTVDRRVEIKVDWGKIKAAATSCDSVFVYVTAHGTKVGEAELTTARYKDGSPVEFDRWAPSSLDWENCRACHITVIIDLCYSGWEIDRLKKKLDKPGKKVFVMTSSDASHESGSWGWWQVRGATGGVLTTGLTNAFASQSAGGGAPSMPSLFSGALGEVNGTTLSEAVRQQNPQIWIRLPQPGETCAVEPSSTIDRPSSPPPPPPPTPPPASAPPTPTVPRQTTGAGTVPGATGSVSPLARVNLVAVIAEGANNSTSSSITDPVAGRVWTAVCPSSLGSLGSTWRLYLRVEGQNLNLGDQVHLTLSGPNMPSDFTMTLDDTKDTTSNLPGHTAFIGPFPAIAGTINITLTADSVNGVPLAVKQTLQRSLSCG